MFARSPRIRLAAVTAAALTALATGAATATAAVSADPVPVKPGVFFTGVVNGQTSGAQITVVCSTTADVGHPAPGQSVEAITAATTAAATGYTGTVGTSLTVQITTAGGAVTTTSLIGVLNNFYELLAIPTDLTLPCSGTGVVSFAPTPTSPTAVTATVAVKLVTGATPVSAARRS
jgi:hypothetical protein